MSFLSVTKNSPAPIKKIRFILPSLDSGGAERVCLNLAKGFLEKGVQVEFLLLTPSVQLKLPPGAEVTFLGRNLNRGKWISGIVALFRLWRLFSSAKPAEVFVASVRGAVILSLLASAFTRPSPRLFIREAALYFPKPWYPELFHRFSLRVLYPRATAVIAVSESVKKELVERFGYKKNVSVINNPVDTKNIRELSLKSSHTSRFPFTFLAVGRLVKEKGFFHLLEAFSKVSDDKGCGLYIVGSGELESKLRSRADELQISDQVVWLGYQSNPYPWYQLADTFVLSSINEGFVNVLAEALALGVPSIVATRCGGGPDELLRNHPSSWLVSPGDADELAAAMIKAKEHCRRRSIKTSHPVPDILTITDSYLDIFLNGSN